MIGPVVLFSLLIAVLWAWSLFTHPQMRCSRCTGSAAYLGPLHTPTSGTCSKCGGQARVSAGGLRPCACSAGTSDPPGGCGGAPHPPREQGVGGASIPQPADQMGTDRLG